MEALSKGTKLKVCNGHPVKNAQAQKTLQIGTATGQHSFAHEQSQLVQDQTTKFVIFRDPISKFVHSYLSLQGGSSKVDILICTPGRLIDHIVGTPNFSLQHLRFLVGHIAFINQCRYESLSSAR